uniref:Uncharacterized protein n=1 Tax=Cucumis melo TaxID=3656 RepID=A0A9I9EI83_CUCME
MSENGLPNSHSSSTMALDSNLSFPTSNSLSFDVGKSKCFSKNCWVFAVPIPHLKKNRNFQMGESFLNVFLKSWVILEHGSGHLIVAISGKCFNLTVGEPVGHFSSMQQNQKSSSPKFEIGFDIVQEHVKRTTKVT